MKRLSAVQSVRNQSTSALVDSVLDVVAPLSDAAADELRARLLEAFERSPEERQRVAAALVACGQSVEAGDAALVPTPDASRRRGALPDWREFVKKTERCTLTLADVWAKYLEDALARGKRPRTYVSAWQTVVGPAFGDFDVRRIEREMVLAWIEAQRRVPYAPKTIRRHVSMLSTLLDHAIAVGAADANVVRLLPRGSLPRSRRVDPTRAANEVLSMEDVAKVISDDRLPADRRAFYALGFLTGARFGEIAALRWEDYTPARKPLGELVIRRSWDCRARRMVPTKTESVTRIPVHPRLAEVLAEAREWWSATFSIPRDATGLICPRRPVSMERVAGEEMLARGCSTAEISRELGVSDFAVRSWRKRPLDVIDAAQPRHQHGTLKRFREDLRLIGIDAPSSGPRRLHSMRHTFVTQLRAAGVERDVAQRLTHSPSSRDAYDGYVHPTWDQLSSAIRRLEVPAR